MTEPRLAEPAPVEPTNGAGTMPLDPDQSNVSQDPTPDLDEAEHAALLATAGGLTAHQILTWEASQIGTGEHPPGSNHTIYNLWGDGAWCFYFQSYGFKKYNALDLIHGAHGYVPDFKGIFQPHGEFHTSSPRAGDLVAFDFNRSGEPEHIGMVEKVISGSTIQTIEGNTSDKVMRRTRSRSYVYGYATPKYGTTPTGDDDVPEYVSLGMKKAQTVKAGQAAHAVFDVEYGDAGKAHADGAYPGIVSGGAKKTSFMLEADVTGEGSVRLVETDPKHDYKVTKTYPLKKIVSGEPVVWLGKIEPNQHLYLEFHPSADGTMNAAVKCHYWHL